MKYFWEISVPDDAYERFVNRLERCEKAELTFVFAVIKRYEGHRLIYGFTNFEVMEDEAITCFDFEFRNDDILCNRFRQWESESSHLIVPFSLLGYLRVMEAISKESAKIKSLIGEEN